MSAAMINWMIAQAIRWPRAMAPPHWRQKKNKSVIKRFRNQKKRERDKKTIKKCIRFCFQNSGDSKLHFTTDKQRRNANRNLFIFFIDADEVRGEKQLKCNCISKLICDMESPSLDRDGESQWSVGTEASKSVSWARPCRCRLLAVEAIDVEVDLRRQHVENYQFKTKIVRFLQLDRIQEYIYEWTLYQRL